MKKLMGIASAVALVGSVTAAQANGIDLSGTVSMGLQATTANGSTTVSPYTRVQGTASYTMETDIGVTFVLAIDFDTSLHEPEAGFLPGHR